MFMPCTYSYLLVHFYKRLDGAVSITVYSKNLKSNPKVEGSSPSKTFFICFYFLLLSQRCRKFSRFTFVQKKACFDVLYTCKATSLNFVLRYSDDAGAVIENVYTFCVKEKKSGMNRVWDRTAALIGVSRTTAQKNVVEKKKAHDEQQMPTTKAATVIYVESVTG